MDFLTSLVNSMPGAVAQGLIWGIMAIGVYITYRILDVADLTVDGSLGTGGAVCVVLVLNGVPVGVALVAATLAGMLAGLVTGLFHTACGIPAILAGILTQLALYSVNLRIMGFGTGGGKANLPISVDKYKLLVSSRYVRDIKVDNPIFILAIFLIIIIFVLYWFFGTELGSSLRATGANGNMARAQGINTNFTKVLGLMISNGLVALSGALLSQYQGFSDINMGRGAIVIGLAAVIIGEVIFSRIFRNFALKLLSAVIGGWFDLIVQRIVDAFGCIPQMLLLLLMMSLMGNGIPQMIVALAVPSGIGGSRMVRSSALAVKDSGYCDNSDLLGGGVLWKSVKHVVPNIMPLIIISAAGSLGGVVMMEASMNFLGYGVAPGTPSWGALITGQGRDMLFTAPWLCIIPGIAIALLTFCSSMFGDAIRDLLDPRLKGGVGSYNSKKLKKVLAALEHKDEFEQDMSDIA